MSRETARRSPCNSASYSASLLETLNRIWNTYFNCSPLGEMNRTPRCLRRAWVNHRSRLPNAQGCWEVLGFDSPATRLRSRLVLVTWLLFLAWSWFPRLPVQLSTLRFVQWHPDCGVYPQWEVSYYWDLVLIKVIPELPGGDQNSIQKFLNWWISNLWFREYFANEVDWSLNVVSVAFLRAFDYYRRTDYMGSHSDVEE